MKEYAKIILYAYPLLATVERDYEEHIRNRAILSYGDRWNAQQTAEYLAGEIICMRRLEWLKARLSEVFAKLTDEERVLVKIRYCGKSKKSRSEKNEAEQRIATWTERTYFRRQARLGEKLGALLTLAGVTEEVYLNEFSQMEMFEKISRYLSAKKEGKISARERRRIGAV